MKRVARTGQLADRLSRAEFRQKRAAQNGVAADREPENIRDLAERLSGASDRGRTGDVQVWKGADEGEPGKPEDENP